MPSFVRHCLGSRVANPRERKLHLYIYIYKCVIRVYMCTTFFFRYWQTKMNKIA